MISVKLISIFIAGIATVLGATSPLMHIGNTQSSWKTKWYRGDNFEIPVFGDCTPTNSEVKEKKVLTVTLAFDESASREADSNIFLKVFEVSNKGTNNLIWDTRRDDSAQGGDWSKLKLWYDSKTDIDFNYPYRTSDHIERWSKTNCKVKNIEFKTDGNGFLHSQEILLKNIVLTLTEDDKCRKYFGGVECNVDIGPSNQLRWKKGFQPKITYKAFG